MKSRLQLRFLCATIAAWGFLMFQPARAVRSDAQSVAPQAQPPQKPDQVQLPKGQMPNLGRPTQKDDQLPLFNFDEYFVGKWTFEWEVPDGPLGPGGKIAGTTVYRAVDGRFYEADTDATGPAGPFKIHELIAYHRENKVLARQVADSRGFSFMQIAPIGGDLGGSYNIYYESQPFTYNAKTVRIKHAMRLLSPVNYKVGVTVSVDGGRFLNYGNPWWQKQVFGGLSR
jgi:Protein of unknown function (DUF1579)